MSTPDYNDSARGGGQRLRQAREAAGLAIADVSARLKVPTRIIQALEEGDYARIGAPVFVRGHLRSYSRLLGLPTEPIQAASGVAPIEPTTLVPRTRTPMLQRLADQVGGRLVYVVITALLILPVWVATRSHLDSQQAAPLDLPAGQLATDTTAGPSARSALRKPATVVASMASLPARNSANALELHFSADSWVQIRARDGAMIEQALVKAGESRSYPAGDVGSVVLGNAADVQLQVNGSQQDLTPYMRANVARFAVSSGGSLEPVDN